MIVIKDVYIDKDDDVSTLVTDMTVNGMLNRLKISCNEDYEKYMVTENCDAALSFMVEWAMKKRMDIVCEVPVTSEFLYNMHELVKISCVFSPRLYPTKIKAKTIKALPSEGAVVTSASMGVDSLFAINKFYNHPIGEFKLTHLMHNDVLEFRDLRSRFIKGGMSKDDALKTSEVVKENFRKNAQAAADELDLPLLKFDTNISRWGVNSNNFLFAAVYAYVGHSFQKLFGKVVVGGGHDLTHFSLDDIFAKDTSCHELFNTHIFSTNNLSFVPDGLIDDRLDRTAAIANFPIAQRHLNVCWLTKDGVQCNTCGKCMRTILMLDYFDCLEKFGNIFDVDFYKKNFKKYKECLLDTTQVSSNLRLGGERYRAVIEKILQKREPLTRS
ncbi:MAG: hypothetical protein LBL93_03000 [Ruminococcus sp.]|nr:hypothetical protein [Ruminococcus sp.]